MAIKESGVSAVSVGALLAQDLRIPEYQRPYSWHPETALQLVDDVMDALAGIQDVPYVLGAVILHEREAFDIPKPFKFLSSGDRRCRAFEKDAKFLLTNRLGEVVECTAPHGFDCIFNFTKCGYENDRLNRAGCLYEIYSVAVWKADIGDDKINLGIARKLEFGRLEASRANHDVAERFHEFTHDLQILRGVFGN